MKLAPGELLDEAEIAKRFSLSRSPVREALIKLSSEGVIKTLPNKNTVVKTLSFQEVPKFLDASNLMQRVSARLAAIHRTAIASIREVDPKI